MRERSLAGGCQCGAIRYRFSGEPLLAAICHCTMCRRANAAPAVAWAMLQEAQVAFLAGAPTTYASSPGARRGFCAGCGTQISFTADYIRGLVDLTVGSLDQPERIAPTLRYWERRSTRNFRRSSGLAQHAAPDLRAPGQGSRSPTRRAG